MKPFQIGDRVKFAASRDPELRDFRGTVTDVQKSVVYVAWDHARTRKEFVEHVELAEGPK